MPFNTGLIVYIIVLVAIVIWAIYETYTNKSITRQNIAFLASIAMLGIPFYGYGWSAVVVGIVILAALWFLLQYKKDKVYLVSARVKNTALLCMLMLMIGYSSYALIVIRSDANPPMDQNSPEDIFTLGSYLSRDQYGDSPLVYGQAYTSQVAFDVEGQYCKPRMTEGAPVYQRKEKATPDEKDSYFIVRHKSNYKYAQNMLFPRMHDAAHAQSYEQWMQGAPTWIVKGTAKDYDRCGEIVSVRMPSQLENLFFFFSYQCNFMYWRYFMWNFAGRQNDVQGNGELEHGNWITGIPFIDNARLGNQDLLPDELKENKGHNVFFCLPLIIGLIGLFWQAYRGKRGIQQFWVVFFLFFMTGLAIVIYLNQTPVQPRERDYAYAGSFYAYAIWCGIGVAALYDLIKKHFKMNGNLVAAVTGGLCLLIPLQMVSQTWDDHDRSGRYTCRDFGQNYLMSLQDTGNPIIFTNGDNDTFPLWYNQEAEGVRTDARVCNLSYLQTDWYIDQMRRPAYESSSVPITWPRIDYCAGTNEYVEIDPSQKEDLLKFYQDEPLTAKREFGDEPFELKNILAHWVRSPHKEFHLIPTDTVYVTIDKEAVRKSGMMMASDSIPDKMVISLKGKNALYKGDLMMLEMIANCNWTRPIYVAITVGQENYMNLGDNFIQEGLANRISPFTTNKAGAKNFDTEKTFNNVMNKFKFGGVDAPGIYLDETVMRMCYTHRRLLSTLALHLVQEGKDQKAKQVLDKAEKCLPDYNIPHDYQSGSLDIARSYALTAQPKKAQQVINALWTKSMQYLQYYCSLDGSQFSLSQHDCMIQLYIMQQILQIEDLVDQKKADAMEKQLQGYMSSYESKGGNWGE